jgi:hypothetical protein
MPQTDGLGRRRAVAPSLKRLVRMPGREQAPEAIREEDGAFVVQQRDRRYKRALGVADVFSACAALLLCTSVLGDVHRAAAHRLREQDARPLRP